MFQFKRQNKRIIADRIFLWAIIGMSSLTVIPLLSIIWELLSKGYQQITFSFFTEVAPSTLDAMMANASGDSIPGGILNGITGTLLMVGMASLVAIPTGVFCGIFLYEGKHTRFCNIIRFLTEIIQGLPSIVIGVIIYSLIVVNVTHGYSALAGSIALCVMMLPLIIRSTEESLRMLPLSLKEAGLALGVPYTSVIFRILLPASFSGLFTGILLALSRVLGETAPLLVTALQCSAVNWDIVKPTDAIPLLIWQFYQDPNLVDMVWSSSLFLLAIVLLLNLLSKHLSKKWRIS